MINSDNKRILNSRKWKNNNIRHKERGVVAVIVALSLVAMIGFVGLALV